MIVQSSSDSLWSIPKSVYFNMTYDADNVYIDTNIIYSGSGKGELAFNLISDALMDGSRNLDLRNI